MPYNTVEKKRTWSRSYARRWRAQNPQRASAAVLRSRDPVKHRARAAVAYAKKKGWIVPQPCEVCGVADVQAHHDDYGKPLEVRWLCRPHHVQADSQ